MPYTFRYGDRPLEGVTVQRAVGRGGFGEVYYAVTDSGKQVALKYLRENPEIELRGISHVMNLKSPHLITIYDVRKNVANEPFVIMEYISGPSLRELLIAEPHGLGPQKAAFFLDGIAKGLAYLHDRGIVHRDLKPANIFYDDGYVKIGDYGLSKHMSISRHSGQTVSVGTVHYMAPEIGSGSYTKAIDVYALGVILYEMLTGGLPFSGSSMGEILMRHLSDRPDLSGIPEPFASVIAKALAKDPHDRYADANEMVDAVRAHVDISQSIASFDPNTLTRVPRDPEATDDETLTRPAVRRPPPPPPLDVHVAPRVEGLPREVAEKFKKKAAKYAKKLEKQAEKLRRKGGELMGHEYPHEYAETAPAPQRGGIFRRGRRGQLLVLAAVAIAVGIGLGQLTRRGSEDETIAVIFAILGASIGGLVAYFKFILPGPWRSKGWQRLTYAGVSMIFLIPAIAIAGDFSDEMGRMAFVPVIIMLIFDWSKRVRHGLSGEVRGGEAVGPGIMGLIIAGILDAEGYELVAGGICATVSLLTQAGASLWGPVTARPTRADAPHGEDWQRHYDTDMSPIASPALASSRGGGESADIHSPEAPAAVSDVANSSTSDPPRRQSAAQPLIIDAAAPSFVGRTFNAGLAFIGKILLLAAIVLALGQEAIGRRVLERFAETAEGTEHALDPALRQLLTTQIPEPLVMLAGAIGCALLLMARRSGGTIHLLRGCIAAALGLWGLVMALGPAAWAWQALLSGETPWSKLPWDNLAGPLLISVLPLAAAFLLFAWPRRRTPHTLTI